ncbi:MAG: IclR family transcriptional regulator [Myxococcales bacterium]|nr:IclR family transcriptional regulator [Myxococcales bacterium]
MSEQSSNFGASGEYANAVADRDGAAVPIEASSSLDKAIDILLELQRAGSPLGVTAAARAAGLPKSSAHRLLQGLARRGLVEQDAQGRYRPGFVLVALGLGALETDPVVGAARPVLEEEAAALGETVFLTAVRGGRIAVLAKTEGTGFLRAAPQVGSTVPTHATAVGKLQLAFAPDELGSMGEPVRERFTARTATSAAELELAAADARRTGWATNREEWIPGLAVVAAPVFRSGRLVAALAVAASSARLDELGVERVARRAVAAAERIGARLAGECAPSAGGDR